MKAKKGDIVHKLKIARGQLDGILQMVEENRYGAWCVGGCVRDALQTDAVNPKLEEALKLLEKMIQ